MGKFLDKLRKTLSFVPKKALIAFGIATAVAVPLAVSAYGPERATFTMDSPASYVTFNSITNNPDIGDERNFVAARVDNGSSAGLNNVWNANEITAVDGESYFVRMYVHNNAAANLNLVAENVRAHAAIPTGTATSQTISGYISSSNANPTTVWDYVTFTSDQEFYLAVDSDYGVHYANNSVGYGTDAKLDYGNFFNTNGALLGYDKLDGRIPGCFQYDGYVSFKVRAIFLEQDTDFRASKQVSAHGEKNWGETYEANPGELVDFRIDYTNLTGERQDNVTLKDELPEGLTVGSVRWYNLNTGEWQNAVNDITTTGINIGSYIDINTQTRAELTVKMPDEEELECGVNTFKNIGKVSINGGVPKEDDATVTITKDCPEPEKEFTCDRLNINPVTRTSFDFTTDYTIVNTTYNNISYVISGNNIYDARTSTAVNGALSYSQLVPGTYKVVATLNTADGSNTNKNCEGEFTVEAEPEPSEAICEVLTANPKTIKTGGAVGFRVYPAYTGNVQVVGSYIDFGDGVVTNPANTLSYSHIYTKDGEYKVKAYINFIVDGKEVNDVSSVECEETIKATPTPPEEWCEVPGKEHLPKDDPGCKEDEEEWCEVPGKEHLKPNDPDCVSNPVNPNEPTYLPKTGLEVFGILGLGSMTTAGAYYVASRRALKK